MLDGRRETNKPNRNYITLQLPTVIIFINPKKNYPYLPFGCALIPNTDRNLFKDYPKKEKKIQIK